MREAAVDSGTAATLLCIRGATACLANAGDSRAHFLHEGLPEQISREHPPGGSDEAACVHEPCRASGIPLKRGDVFLLCSGGLTGCLRAGARGAAGRRRRQHHRAADADHLH